MWHRHRPAVPLRPASEHARDEPYWAFRVARPAVSVCPPACPLADVHTQQVAVYGIVIQPAEGFDAPRV